MRRKYPLLMYGNIPYLLTISIHPRLHVGFPTEEKPEFAAVFLHINKPRSQTRYSAYTRGSHFHTVHGSGPKNRSPLNEFLMSIWAEGDVEISMRDFRQTRSPTKNTAMGVF